ncbi:hypothetical protein Runsl_1747 [Runella slithyformis DSM 19594]|uniref:Uncharacterized protein n=1 Tax=Runella slithyformis (strain ATCC 29530 / DSM 19594 / LMG 11500 / NCIMB 11436 / LSU 4) TaxID=761193 RepID=A0A7U3ZJ41_RUNSL|nr:hypothetical protein Runsl_1747 [Runella slithyformis DSM 19594]
MVNRYPLTCMSTNGFKPQSYDLNSIVGWNLGLRTQTLDGLMYPADALSSKS